MFCHNLRRTVFKASAGPGYPVLEDVNELVTFCNRAGELFNRIYDRNMSLSPSSPASGIEAMTRAMKSFVEFVYPAAQEARQNIISKLQSETTIATFISGVTATSKLIPPSDILLILNRL